MSDLSTVSDEDIKTVLLDRDIVSLRDVQYTYGALHQVSNGLTGEYETFYTPWEFKEYAVENTDEEDAAERVIVCDVDIETKTISDVFAMPYSEDMWNKVAHSKRDSSRGNDHNITKESGEHEPEQCGKGMVKRFKWATDDAIVDFTENEGHEDTYIIENLREMLEDDELMNDLQTQVENELSDVSKKRLYTVRINCGDGEYIWPGDVEVFNEAMKHRYNSKLSKKGIENASSYGVTKSFVTGEETDVFGTAPDPLNYFVLKQRGAFANLRNTESWLDYPVTSKESSRIQASHALIDDLRSNAFGYRVYRIPYFTSMNVRKARMLKSLIDDMVNDDYTTLVELVESGAIDDLDLNLYTIILEFKQNNDYQILADESNGNILPIVNLAKEHKNIIQSDLFAKYHPTPTDGNGFTASLLNPDIDTEVLVDLIDNAGYLLVTLPERDDNELTDTRLDIYRNIINGTGVNYTQLIRGYSERIQQYLSENGIDSVPSWLITAQLAQVSALEKSNLLLGVGNIVDENMINELESQETDDEKFDRVEQLKEYMTAFPALSDDERAAAFAAGACVKYMSIYQSSSRGMSNTLVKQYGIKSMNTQRLQRVVTDFVDKSVSYGNRGAIYMDLANYLSEHILNADVSDWDISKEELQYYYALGVVYAANNFKGDNNE